MLKERLIALLRWTERYTGTDMVYLASAGLWSNLGTVFAAVLALGLSVVFANVLPSASYGAYQYLISLSVLVAAISLAGMNAAVSQAAARGYEGVLRIAVRAQLQWSIVPILVSFGAAAYYLSHGNTTVGAGLIIIGVLTPITNTFNTYAGFLEGKRRFKQLFAFGSLVNAIAYGSLFLAAMTTKNVIVLFGVNLLANAVGMGIAYLLTLRTTRPNDSVDPHALSYGKHLSVTSAFTTAMNQVDAVLVFHFLGAAPLAVYVLAKMLPERIGGLFTFVGSASLSKFANRSTNEIRGRLLPRMGAVLLITGAVALVYAVCAPLLFTWIYPHYLSSIPFTQGYALVIPLLAVTAVMNALLVAKRRTREIYAVSIAQPLILVGLEVALVVPFGITGIVIGRLLAYAAGPILALTLFFRPLGPVAEHETASVANR